MTSAQLEKLVNDQARRIAALEARVADLTFANESLRAQVNALLPKCYACGCVAAERVRILEGAAKFAHDEWCCESCKPARAA